MTKVISNSVPWYDCFIYGSSVKGANAYSFVYSEYMRISDDLAWLHFNITLSSLDPLMAGNVRIGRIPVKLRAAAGGSTGLAFQNISGITLLPGYTQLGLHAQQGEDYIGLSQFGSGLAAHAVTASQLSSTTTISASGVVRA